MSTKINRKRKATPKNEDEQPESEKTENAGSTKRTKSAAYYDFLDENKDEDDASSASSSTSARGEKTFAFHKRILEHYHSLHGDFNVPYNYYIDPSTNEWPTDMKSVRLVTYPFSFHCSEESLGVIFIIRISFHYTS